MIAWRNGRTIPALECFGDNNCEKIVVISGVGVKEYYRDQLGYKDDGPYVSKSIKWLVKNVKKSQ